MLPTGRNLHGLDPFRMPSAFAVRDGMRQADKLLARYQQDHQALPETVAMVLWGTDNLKTEGSPMAQALALMGAAPRFDSYGRLAGAQLIPLAELGRPRIDVVITLSGIFRDLLPMQIRLLAEAAFLAASADEPRRSKLCAPTCPGLPGRARRQQHGVRRAARLWQHRRRIRRQREPADRQQLLGKRERVGRCLHPAQRFCLRP